MAVHEVSGEDVASGDPGGSPRRWVRRALIAAGLLIVLWAGWVGWRTFQAYRHLDAAGTQVSVLQQQVKNLADIDIDKTDAAVSALRAETDDAVAATSDPLYRLAAHLPWVGPNLRAVRTVADTVDSLATTTAPSLVQVARTAQPSALAPKNGAIDIAPLAAAAGAVEDADTAVTSAEQRIAAVDRGPLVGPIARALDTLAGKLRKLGATTGTAARIGRLAPPMLGASGVRRYLVVFQNLAEPRATGGLIGSYALLQVDHGRLAIVDSGSGERDLGHFDPALPTPPNLPAALYAELPERNTTDTNLTPDFPTSAALLAKMYAIRKNVQVDGVLSIDPVALSYLLAGAKPIPVGQHLALTSSTITAILLSKAYRLYPQASDVPARENFLTDATTKAFDAVTGASGNATNAVHGLTKAADQRRLLLWSWRPSEETDIAATGIAGSLPTADGSTPTVGVFRNDGTGGKLGYYAGGSVDLTPGACESAGHRALTLTVHLTYSAPSTGLPAYVIGYARAGPYVLRTNVLVFAPLTGDLTGLTLDGRTVPVVWAVQQGRKVGAITVDLAPGQQATIVGTMNVAAPGAVAQEFTPALVVTPGVTTWKSTATPFAAC